MDKSLFHRIAKELHYARKQASEDDPKFTIQVSISADLVLKNIPDLGKFFEVVEGMETFKGHKYVVNPRQMEEVVIVER